MVSRLVGEVQLAGSMHARVCDSPPPADNEIAGEGGRAQLTDFMPVDPERNEVIRIVTGLEGRITLRSELLIRFDYGSVIPWVQRRDGGIVAIAGPDGMRFVTPLSSHGENFSTVVNFEIAAGQRLAFVLTYFPSFGAEPQPIDAERACQDTERWWREWCNRSSYEGLWKQEVRGR